MMRPTRESKPRSDEARDLLLHVLREQNEALVDHLGNVARLSAATAVKLGLSVSAVAQTRLAAELHDIGKVAIPPAMLNKAGPLTADERAIMERHSAVGERILRAAPTLAHVASIVRAVHERPDRTGYPDGLTLDAIPIGARVVAVADAFDAMTNDRPYRRALSVEGATAELRRQAGSQFDAAVVEAFCGVLADSGPMPVAA